MVDKFPLFWNDWQWFLHDSWKRQFKMMRAYIETTEQAFAKLEEVILNEPVPPGEESDEIPSRWDEEVYLRVKALQEDFPQFMLHMTFCAMFGYLEHELIRVCDSLWVFRKLSSRVRDERDKGIIGAKRYLTRVAGLPIPDASTEWGKICAYGRIRNAIMHCDSLVLNKYKVDFAKDVKLTGEIEVDILGRLRLSKAYCLSAIDTVQHFLDELAKMLPAETEKDREEGFENLKVAFKEGNFWSK